MNNNRISSKLKLFEQAIKNNRLSHLYLISGMKGSGKKELALNVASILLESDIDEIDKGHINLYLVEPKGQNIRVQQIEELQMEFSKTSLVRGYRVFILDQVERLNQSSANRLLKFLEEPANKNTVGFLLAENIEQVIPTILSRSQIMHLSSQDEKELSASLKEQGVDDLTSELLPYLNKDIDQLMTMVEDEEIKVLINHFDSFTKALLEAENLWLYVDEHLKDIIYNREQIKYFLQFLIVFYLDLYKIKNNQEVSLLSLKERYNGLKGVNSEILQVKLEKTQELLHKINYNINVNMAFSQLIIEIS